MHKVYEEWGIVATVDPDCNNTDDDSDVVDMSLYSEVAILILLGVLNDSATNTVAVRTRPHQQLEAVAAA